MQEIKFSSPNCSFKFSVPLFRAELQKDQELFNNLKDQVRV